MTHEELHALVKDIPEAWPRNVVFERGVFWTSHGDSDDYDLSDDHAELMFIGSVTRALLKLPRTRWFSLERFGTLTGETYAVYRVVPSGIGECPGTSELAALVAAYVAAKKEVEA